MVLAAFVWVFLACIVLLQIFLSRAERKWPGLIFPAIFLLLSILYLFEMPTDTPIWHMCSVCFLGNIPTLIFLAIYFACRPK